MAVQEIANRAKIDILNQTELNDSLGAGLDRFTKDWYQEKARGFDMAPIHGAATVAGGAVQFPRDGSTSTGPKRGNVWAIQRLSCRALATGDVLDIYKSSVDDAHWINSLTGANRVWHPGSTGLILRGGEYLIFVGTGLTATGDIEVNGEAKEVAGLDIYKLL